jgi:hypothetical protein
LPSRSCMRGVDLLYAHSTVCAEQPRVQRTPAAVRSAAHRAPSHAARGGTPARRCVRFAAAKNLRLSPPPESWRASCRSTAVAKQVGPWRVGAEAALGPSRHTAAGAGPTPFKLPPARTSKRRPCTGLRRTGRRMCGRRPSAGAGGRRVAVQPGAHTSPQDGRPTDPPAARPAES